jgi:hypothetical protein
MMTKSQKRRGRRGLGAAALILAAGGLLAVTAPTAARASSGAPQGSSTCPQQIRSTVRTGKFAGIVSAVRIGSNCPAVQTTSNPANGTPPLLFHGGSVMMTPSTSPLVVTPIFWNPASYPIANSYKKILDGYLSDVAAASGVRTNVFSVLNEYYGTNGKIHYNVTLGSPVSDSHALPASGCTVASTDTTGIYADGTGYSACLDDAQLQAEINRVVTAGGLPVNLSHIYVLYLPKHVESCFNPGSTTTSANECTINYQPSAAYCAYHSQISNGTVYANMPYPVYSSATGFTCGSDAVYGVIESPNNNPDADTEISPTSHETSEAITDPDTQTGWYDSSGFEIGDECAYVYGTPSGSAGKYYNQVINGQHFLTQEEFSNKDFAITSDGCVQAAKDEA